MLNDFSTTTRNWRLLHLLGISSLRNRYSRSKLGQTWLTISLFIQILATGIVWSILWHMPIREFLPYVAIGQTIYQFFFLTIQDSTGIFVNDSRLYVNQRLPFMTSVLANLYKNLIIFGHNVPIIIFSIIFSEIPMSSLWDVLISIPLSLLFLVCISYVLACVCVRYRDIIYIMSTLLNISFLVTPILWKLSYVPKQFRNYFFLNPLTSFLEIIRNPLLGLPVNSIAYVSLLSWSVIALLLMIYMHQRFEKKIILWV